jgi:hypothetical protein
MATKKYKPPAGQRKASSGIMADRLRVAVERSLNILDREDMPLHKLLAQAWKDDPIKTLTAVQRLLPVEHNVQVMDITQQHLAAVRALSGLSALPSPTEEPMPVVIDVEPVSALDTHNYVTQNSGAGEGASHPEDDPNDDE